MNIVSTFVTALSEFATGMVSTVVNVFEGLFITEGGGLTNLATWGVVWGSVGLGIFVVNRFAKKAS